MLSSTILNARTNFEGDHEISRGKFLLGTHLQFLIFFCGRVDNFRPL